MASSLLNPNPENASLHELKNTARIGSGETSLRCTAIQMLLANLPLNQICKALLIFKRSLRIWISLFNEKGRMGSSSISALEELQLFTVSRRIN
jgi:hypothetical protein